MEPGSVPAKKTPACGVMKSLRRHPGNGSLLNESKLSTVYVRPRRPVARRMLRQDGLRHEWIAGAAWDLIVTMGDAASEIHSAFSVAEKGTIPAFWTRRELDRKGDRIVVTLNGMFLPDKKY